MNAAPAPVSFPTVGLVCRATQRRSVYCYSPKHPRDLAVLFSPGKVTVIRGNDATTYFLHR